MPTSTSLNLQALLKTAAARTGMDSAASHVRGLSSSAQALYVAVQSSHRKRRRLRRRRAGRRRRRSVLHRHAILHGARSKARPPRRSRARSSRSRRCKSIRTAISRRISASRRRARRRLHAIASGTAKVVVASAAALLTRLSAPDSLEAAAIELKNGMDLDPVVLGDLLADAGFTREDPVDEHGEFCVRGGIVDYFPAGADNPIRVEFVGETVESIRRYDPSTQRSIATLDQAAVVPLTEKSGSATFFDYLPADRDLLVHHRRRRGSRAAGREARRADPRELRGGRKPTTRARRRPKIC